MKKIVDSARADSKAMDEARQESEKGRSDIEIRNDAVNAAKEGRMSAGESESVKTAVGTGFSPWSQGTISTFESMMASPYWGIWGNVLPKGYADNPYVKGALYPAAPTAAAGLAGGLTNLSLNVFRKGVSGAAAFGHGASTAMSALGPLFLTYSLAKMQVDAMSLDQMKTDSATEYMGKVRSDLHGRAEEAKRAMEAVGLTDEARTQRTVAYFILYYVDRLSDVCDAAMQKINAEVMNYGQIPGLIELTKPYSNKGEKMLRLASTLTSLIEGFRSECVSMVESGKGSADGIEKLYVRYVGEVGDEARKYFEELLKFVASQKGENVRAYYETGVQETIEKAAGVRGVVSAGNYARAYGDIARQKWMRPVVPVRQVKATVGKATTYVPYDDLSGMGAADRASYGNADGTWAKEVDPTVDLIGLFRENFELREDGIYRRDTGDLVMKSVPRGRGRNLKGREYDRLAYMLSTEDPEALSKSRPAVYNQVNQMFSPQDGSVLRNVFMPIMQIPGGN